MATVNKRPRLPHRNPRDNRAWLNNPSPPQMPDSGANFRAWLLVAIGGIVLTFIFKNSAEPVAKTNCGQVRGVKGISKENGLKYFSFRGIPYAASPSGHRRWHAPEPLSKQMGTCWNGIFLADMPGFQCAQQDPFTGKFVGHEDCLVLDVFTPTLNANKGLPVLVYFHGGYLRFGNISTPGFFPDGEVATALEAVVVNVQYRLGALGFLVLDELKDRPGNYGILDQIEALKWVRRNIRQFGGDPKQVTIFGQSSGGSSVLYLMTTPLAKGLFHRAWSASGSPVFHHTYDDAIRTNAFFPKKVGCANTAEVEKCLMQLTAEEVSMAVFPEWSFDHGMNLPEKGVLEMPLVVVDGNLFTRGLRDTFKLGEKDTKYINDVPLLLGTTAQESEVFPYISGPTSSNISSWPKSDYENYIRQHLDTFKPDLAATALELYPYEENPLKVYTNMVSDIRVSCPNDIIGVEAAAVMESPIFRYVVTATPSSVVSRGVPFSCHLAFHGLDLLGIIGSLPSFMDGPAKEKDNEFVMLMRKIVKNFIYDGKPGESSWKPFPKSVGLIEDHGRVKVKDSYHKKECDFWLSNDFFEYGWMN